MVVARRAHPRAVIGRGWRCAVHQRYFAHWIPGAERYPLPPNAGDAHAAKTNVYGYLLATVNAEGKLPGTIDFKFEELSEKQIPDEVVQRFGKPTVHERFVGNRRNMPIE